MHAHAADRARMPRRELIAATIAGLGCGRLWLALGSFRYADGLADFRKVGVNGLLRQVRIR